MTRRKLSREEHALWRAVTQTIKPLRRQPLLPPVAELIVEPPLDKPKPGRAKSPAAIPPAMPAPVKSPPLTAIDRRTKQKIVRGSVAIDARIDLHGLTQERAHTALLRFVRAAHANDARLVLVITGKGAPNGERGVLRRMVPHWLALPELRASVIGFEIAHVAHGGEGALYVRIRRRQG